MKFSVHNKLNGRRFGPVSKGGKVLTAASLGFFLGMEALIIGLLISVEAYLQALWMGIIWSLAIVFITTLTVLTVALPLHSGYLRLGDCIVFHNTLGHYRHSRHSYEKVAWLYTGYCPKRFTKAKNMGRIRILYSYEEWEALYGNYIVGLNQDKKVLFICGYDQAAWELLKEKCPQAKTYNLTAEDYLAYNRELAEMEANTNKLHGYAQEIEKYDGYVN